MEQGLGPIPHLGPLQQGPLESLGGSGAGQAAPAERPSPLSERPAYGAPILSMWEGNSQVGPSYAQYTANTAPDAASIVIRDAETQQILQEMSPEEASRAAETIQAYLAALRTRRGLST